MYVSLVFLYLIVPIVGKKSVIELSGIFFYRNIRGVIGIALAFVTTPGNTTLNNRAWATMESLVNNVYMCKSFF